MILAGSTINIPWNYKPVTNISVTWEQKSDGNWRAVDRGISQDSYMADIVFQGVRSQLEGLETALDSNRNEFTATFGSGEEIFGADVDHSGNQTVTVTKYGGIRRISNPFWEMPLTLKLISPSFVSITGTLENITLQSFQSNQFSEFDITREFTYDQVGNHLDQERDPGYFSAEFEQTHTQMQEIRTYIRSTNRTGSLTFPTINGVSTPFGYREGTGPFTVRLIEWEDLGRKNLLDWGLRLKFAREFS